MRTETIDARGLVDDAAARSPNIRALVDRLEHSDVVVYVRFARFGRTQLNGRVGFLSTGGGWRYLIVELACPRVRSEQIATLGHELHHAVEIADAPAVIGPRSLAQHYSRIGMQVDATAGAEMFETRGAIDEGTRVRRDLSTRPAATTEER